MAKPTQDYRMSIAGTQPPLDFVGLDQLIPTATPLTADAIRKGSHSAADNPLLEWIEPHSLLSRTVWIRGRYIKMPELVKDGE